MTVSLPWPFGTIVYLRIAGERCKGMVTGYNVNDSGVMCYVTWPDRSETRHYAFELTTEFVADYE